METQPTPIITATNSKKTRVANIILFVVLLPLLAAQIYFGYQLHTISKEQEQLKEDYSTFNSISFGVFSIDLWREKIADIVNDKIKDFKIAPEQKADLRKAIEKELHATINQLVNEINRPQKSLGGKLKKFAFRQFVEPQELHAQVPSFARTIVNRLTSTKATNKIKGIASTKFEELADQTYDSTQTAITNASAQLFKKYNVKDAKSYNTQLEKEMTQIRKVTYNYAYAMIACMVLTILLWIFLRNKVYLQTMLFVMSLAQALSLLLTGTTVSIIEVDARISTLEFTMMGEKVIFDNQVIFYQNQSILGIAKVLIGQAKPDAITVGVLIILFVIILPLLRMIARGIHMLCRPPIAENGVTKYLAFECEKWDMADVMVVGILMTYIGLNGILKSQLGGLNMKDEVIFTNTVNNSSLQPGYIVFVAYVVFGATLSYFLRRITEAKKCAV
ncbi:MAG: 2-methylisocitrate lyase [Flavobacterium sp.]|nr:MAG: 2-methylisocitrate lyase [Flavobacterium sp.]